LFSILKRLARGTGGNPQEELRRLRDIFARYHMRRDQDTLAGLDVIHAGADRMHSSDRVAAGRERAIRRTVDRKPAFHVRFQIGHESGGFDPHQDAARARLGDGRVFKSKSSAEAVEQPCFH
jgi:hypothetical protein